MKVYTNPIKVSCRNKFLNSKDFFGMLCNIKGQNDAVKNILSGHNISTNAFERISVFDQDSEVYAALFFTHHKRKGMFGIQEKEGKAKITKEILRQKVGEINLLVIKKDTMKGVYVHYKGGFSPTSMASTTSKIHDRFVKEIIKEKTRGRKLTVSNIVNNADLINKIERFSKILDVNMTFSHKNYAKSNGFVPQTSARDKFKNIKIVGRPWDVFNSKGDVDEELIEELTSLVDQDLCSSMSMRGQLKNMDAVESINILETVNHVDIEDFEAVLDKIEGCDLEDFMSSPLFLQAKDIIFNSKHKRLFM